MRTKVLSVIRLKALGPPVCACVRVCVRAFMRVRLFVCR